MLKIKTFSIIISVTFLFLGTWQYGYGQDKFIKAYIVELNNDTVKGFLNYGNWDRNPRRIEFKAGDENSINKYTPLDIKAFGALDEVYESAVVETENSTVTTRDLTFDKELQTGMDTAFLQSVIRGPKSLYYYKNRFGKELYYIKTDNEFTLLIYKKYFKDNNGQTVIAENNRYIGQLTVYFQDCPKIQEKLESATYDKSSLEEIFLAYYACTNKEVKFHKKSERTSVEFGLLAGISLTSLKFSGANYAYLEYAGYGLSLNFSGGLFLDVIIPRIKKRLSVCNELIVSMYRTNGEYNDYNSENKYTLNYTTFGYTYLKLNNLIRYKQPIGKMFLFFNAGISNGYAITEENYRRQEVTFYTQKRVEEGPALASTRKWELGFIAGLGAKYKHFSIEFRYEYGNGIGATSGISSSTNRGYCFLGYRF